MQRQGAGVEARDIRALPGLQGSPHALIRPGAGGLRVGYAFSPIDLIPDFVPILGYLDDLILIPLGIALLLKVIPSEIMAECREKAAAVMTSGKPRNWLVAGIIMLIWIVLAASVSVG
jgi:Protein of unknown function (DUF1232)